MWEDTVVVDIIIMLIAGVIAGWLADRSCGFGFGLLWNIIIGIVGASSAFGCAQLGFNPFAGYRFGRHCTIGGDPW
jgi:uncharacterized membrane protein YeaQ/YmgE (transglycosylase-associated protein family)